MPRPSKTGVRGLYRDQHGRYRIDLRWRDPDTGEQRRHRERLPPRTSAVAAKERARRIYAAAIAGDFDPHREAPKRLSALIEKYLEWAELHRPDSFSARRSHCKVIQNHLADPTLARLSPLDVERLKRDYLKGGRAPSTTNRVLATLKQMIRFAGDWEWMDERLARSIRNVKLLKEPAGRVRYLHADERDALMGKLSGELLAIVQTALLTGMRLSEILRLRSDDIHLARRQLYVARSKNGLARWLPINDALADVLGGRATKPGTLAFPSRRGRQRRSDSTSRAFRKVVDAARVEDFHFHDLRHDFATRLRRKNVGLVLRCAPSDTGRCA